MLLMLRVSVAIGFLSTFSAITPVIFRTPPARCLRMVFMSLKRLWVVFIVARFHGHKVAHLVIDADP